MSYKNNCCICAEDLNYEKHTHTFGQTYQLVYVFRISKSKYIYPFSVCCAFFIAVICMLLFLCHKLNEKSTACLFSFRKVNAEFIQIDTLVNHYGN